jgi:hypothetical protein
MKSNHRKKPFKRLQTLKESDVFIKNFADIDNRTYIVERAKAHKSGTTPRYFRRLNEAFNIQ